jgi:hypothetical protein
LIKLVVVLCRVGGRGGGMITGRGATNPRHINAISYPAKHNNFAKPTHPPYHFPINRPGPPPVHPSPDSQPKLRWSKSVLSFAMRISVVTVAICLSKCGLPGFSVRT